MPQKKIRIRNNSYSFPCKRVHKGNAGDEEEIFISLHENKIGNTRIYTRVRPTIVAMEKQ
jgi:hypothetical protein